MQFRDERSALREGALLVVRTPETAYDLGTLDSVLKPWIRRRLDVLADLTHASDTLREVAEDTRRVARVAADYSLLREQLRSDLNDSGPEPPWRVMEPHTMAIRAQSRVRLAQPTFVLQRVTPKAASGNGSDWEFTVIPATPDPGGLHGIFALRMPGGSHGAAFIPVHTPPALVSQPASYQQLEYGFRALGITPFLTTPKN
jgi:hypothetical protein